MQTLPRKVGWHLREMRGRTTTAFNKQVTPLGRTVQVNWPGGSFLWQRPVGVEVRQGNTVRRVPIYNATFYVIAAIFLCGVAMIALASLWVRRSSQSRRTA